jgi:uncharacterized membrane protein YgdD (TMEM256/DUF423 family)
VFAGRAAPQTCYGFRMMRSAITWAGALGATAVMCGAFGAHGLAARLAETGYAEQWRTAALYHLVHAVAAGLAGIPGLSPKASQVALGAFVVGAVLFSGSLYVLAVTGYRFLGAVTPFGGVAFIAGWIALLVAARGAAPAR